MRFSLTALFCILTSISVYGQKNDSISARQLSEVEVSALNKPSSLLSTSPLQTLTNQELLQRGIQSVSDAVRNFSGIVLKDYGGIGGLKTISVRGMGAEHTAVSYDGIMVSNMQSGQVDIGRFSLDNVSMISLNIGQSDNIFQTARAFASVGVLNLETITPQFAGRTYKGYAKITGGSFGLFNPVVDYARKLNDKFILSVNGSWQRADGRYPFTQEDDKLLPNRKRKNNDLDIFRTEVNLYSNLGDAGNLKTKIYFFDSERGLPGSVIIGNEQAKERLWERNFFAQTSYNNNLGSKFKLKSQLKYDNSYTKYMDVNSQYEGIYGTNKNINRYTEQEVYFSNSLLYTLDEKIQMSVSEDLSYNRLTDKMTQPLNPESFMQRAHPKRYGSLTAAAIKYNTKRITLTTSLLMTYLKDKTQNSDGDRTYDKLSPSVGISYQPFDATMLRIRSSYKHSFRVPTFTELYYATVNKNLKPESAKQFNLGIGWVGNISSSLISYINISADGYYNKVDDKIVIIPSLFLPRTINFGEVEMKGLDVKLSTEILINKKISAALSGTYSYMKAIDVTSSDEKNYKDQIPYTPLHSGSASVTLNNPWVIFSYTMIASGERYINAQNIKDNRIDGYTDHSISLYKEIAVKRNLLYLQGSVSNIWNQRYDIIKYYPMAGRSFKVTAGYKF